MFLRLNDDLDTFQEPIRWDLALEALERRATLEISMITANRLRFMTRLDALLIWITGQSIILKMALNLKRLFELNRI